MKVLIETYHLLKKLGIYKAYTTAEIVRITGKQRCAVLKRLHRLENGGFIESKSGKKGEFYWKVKQVPDKPRGPKVWKESKSLKELEEEDANSTN